MINAKRRSIPLIWLVIATAGLLLAWATWEQFQGDRAVLFGDLSNLSTILLGIFIEAAPFLLLGALISGVIEVFFSGQDFSRWIPHNPFLAALCGALFGLVFPVCECGVVPFTRRLFRKGLPAPVGIAFVLGAPALNPIVIGSTLVAFGWGPVLWGRVGLTILIATLTGFLFSFQKDSAQMLNAVTLDFICDRPAPEGEPGEAQTLPGQLGRVLTIATGEFFEIGRYLVLGATLAGVLQIFIPQSALLAISRGPVISVFLLILLAVLLSVCSTVDAFIALSFAGSFTAGSILAFLVYGPMVDIKSTLMFLHVFSRKTVIVMILIPLLLTILLTIFINLNMGL